MKMGKTVNSIMFLFGFIFFGYIGYLLAATYEAGDTIYVMMGRVEEVFYQPFRNYWNEYSLRVIAFFELMFLLVFLYYITSQKTFMTGKEFGTSDWANIKEVMAEIKDPDETKNRILTENVRISLDTKRTDLNNNVLVNGGSGAGKSFKLVTPNLRLANGSFVVTDSKGELLKKNGKYLRKKGYDIRVLNLIDMKKSDHYNPFCYIRKEEDITKLIKNLIANTTPKGAMKGDPFWENAESLLLQSLFYYVWMEKPLKSRNMNAVMDLLAMAKVLEDSPSELDLLMMELAQNSELGERHPAVRSYNKCMSGAPDTIRSILLSVSSRMVFFETQGLQRILESDDMDFASLGTGKSGDGKTKTAIFFVIPDVDKSYNFIVGMAYTQMFQELYYQADFCYDGELPISVSCWMDEFANVAQPEDFSSLISTMRSRNINSVIILQNMAQIKKLYEKDWESITGNCDTLVYLGGNEESSHKYISEALGKKTIDKRSHGRSRGKMPSASQNDDVMGRELMTPAEVRKLKRNKAIVLIRGFDPILDEKYNSVRHLLNNGKSVFERYEHELTKNMHLEFLTEESVAYYEQQKEMGEAVYIHTITIEELSLLDDHEVLSTVLSKQAETMGQKKDDKETSDTLDSEQMEQIRMGLQNGLSQKEVDIYGKVEYTAAQMEQIRLRLEWEKSTLTA